jgi:hypothetical protein
MNFAQHCFNYGGSIHPIIIPSILNSGLGLMNPFDKVMASSDEDGEIIIEDEEFSGMSESESDPIENTDNVVTSTISKNESISESDQEAEDEEFELENAIKNNQRKLVKSDDLDGEYDQEPSQSLDEYEIPLSDDSLISLPDTTSMKKSYLDDGDEMFFQVIQLF